MGVSLPSAFHASERLSCDTFSAEGDGDIEGEAGAEGCGDGV